ncbi:MAG: DNA translocase FtsK 4TM domain-containing protein [Gammaproteobacteria bacterium]
MKKKIKSKSARQATSRGKDDAIGLFQLSRRIREATFILLTALAFYLLTALVTYSSQDPGWSHTGYAEMVRNAGGQTGAFCADVLLYLFGFMAYLLPAATFYGALSVYREEIRVFQGNPWVLFIRGFGLLLAILAGSGLASLHFTGAEKLLPMGSGGILGTAIQQQLVKNLNHLGGAVFLLSFTLIGLTLYTGVSWLKIMDRLGRIFFKGLHYLQSALFQSVKKGYEAYEENKEELKAELKEKLIAPLPKLITTQKVIEPMPDPLLDEISAVEDLPASGKELLKLKPNEKPKLDPKIEKLINPPTTKRPTIVPQAPQIVPVQTTKALQPSPKPCLSLLETVEAVKKSFDPKQLEALSQLVEARLNEFNISVKVVAVYPGPVITRFEMELAPGIKVSRITGLAKDLARSLSVESVRVVEVIPGKSVVGLEIPNQNREIVRLKEILASSVYEQSKSPLSLGLGKSISGEPIVVQLGKMPHLLVAGTTGSGKSVGVNAMLLSILYKATAEEVRLILIDPKMLELSVYEGIPHLLTPVVTDMKDAANALRWCVGEMERRYQVMAATGVRNLESYNLKVEKANQSGKPIFDPLWQPHQGEKPDVLGKMPYIVVVIDEFADMMMVVGKKVEELIARIAQKARAAGIHLILATQRPSVDVITGLIKANIPTRIAFQVSSRIDSRTILDQHGAEQLLGHGDMLYLPAGRGVPVRIHGAFVADDEVHKVIEALRKEGGPNYIQDFKKQSSSPSGGGLFGESSEEEYDPLYDEAVKIVTESRRASISHVQRRLKIGYNRAARLIEQMEADGVVSAMQSNGSREVIAPPPVES